MTSEKKKLVAVVSDLMFTVKIQDAAKRVGMDAIFVNSEQDAVARAKQKPAVIILDLNNRTLDPLHVLAQLKTDHEAKEIPILGYISHVQIDLKRAAEQNGCDQVIPRSVLSKNLPAILGRYAGE